MKKDFLKEHSIFIFSRLIIIMGGIAFYFILLNWEGIYFHIRNIINILMPIIFGGVLAYLLTPVCNRIQQKILRTLTSFTAKKKSSRFLSEKRIHSISHWLSITLSLIFLLLLFYLLISLILPQMIISISGIISILPEGIKNITKEIEKIFADNSQLEDQLSTLFQEAGVYLQNFLQTVLLPNLENIITSLSASIVQVLVFLKNFIIGIIVSVYILSNRKKFSMQATKLVYGCLPVKTAESFLKRVYFTNKVFSGFISGKLIDSLIIGIICFIGTSLLKMPYAMLVSVIVGVTNVIPFFGPYIGAIPSAIIILLVSPIKCLYFLIFILILQQIDGNVIGPKILGDSTGLSSFWVLFSILLFGGLFGLAGMIIAVPGFAVLYRITSDWLNRRLQKKNLPTETTAYAEPENITPEK